MWLLQEDHFWAAGRSELRCVNRLKVIMAMMEVMENLSASAQLCFEAASQCPDTLSECFARENSTCGVSCIVAASGVLVHLRSQVDIEDNLPCNAQNNWRGRLLPF